MHEIRLAPDVYLLYRGLNVGGCIIPLSLREGKILQVLHAAGRLGLTSTALTAAIQCSPKSTKVFIYHLRGKLFLTPFEIECSLGGTHSYYRLKLRNPAHENGNAERSTDLPARPRLHDS